MTDIQKANFVVEGDNIAFGVPFLKVDVEKRTVEGFATLDNIDQSDEVVDAQASVEAFQNWIGNVREMHHPSAVGKAVEIEMNKTYTDPDTGETFNGVWVKSKISKGAEDAWQKVLDGTYSGYSIGGKILDRKPEVRKSAHDDRYSVRNISRITKYHLGELSIVDNPMNQLATFADINKANDHNTLIKSAGGALTPGELLEVDGKGLFYCDPCDLSATSDITKDVVDCATCDNKMVKIGEVADAHPKYGDVRKMVDAHLDLQKNAIRDKRREPLVIDGQEYEVGVWPEAATHVAEMYSYPEDADNTDEGDSANKPGVKEGDVIEVTADQSPNVSLKQVKLPEGNPQGAATPGEVGKADGLDAQNAVGQEVLYHEGGFIIPQNKLELLGKEVLETLKGSVKYKTGKAKKKLFKAEDVEFVDALVNFSKSDFESDEPAKVRAAIAVYNQPGQRTAYEINMSDWNSLGKSLAAKATELFGTETSFEKGFVIGSVVDESKTASDFIINLQKNTTSDTNDVVSVLQGLFSTLRKSKSDTKGGETQTLDPKDFVTKVLETLQTATREIEETAKAWNVQALNNEDASGESVGGGNDGGVGAEGATGSLSADDVTVANPDALASADGGSEKVVPDAIPVDGTGADPGTTVNAGPEKVLPHADLTSASATTNKADGVEEGEDALAKAMNGFVSKIEEFTNRLDAVEQSGGIKKSADVDETELKKSQPENVWGGAFYSADELN